jgi:hypothetical protein
MNLPPGLTWLDLSRNGLASLPPHLCRCTALVHLALGGSKLEGLPAELSGLRGLEKLDLRKNYLQQVLHACAFAGWFGHVQAMRHHKAAPGLWAGPLGAAFARTWNAQCADCLVRGVHRPGVELVSGQALPVSA